MGRLAMLVALLLLALASAVAEGAECAPDSAPRPTPRAAITLEPLRSEGFSLTKGGRDQEIATAAGGRIPIKGRSTAATVTDPPQDDEFDSPEFDMAAAATVVEPGTRVKIRLCTTGGSLTDAGTYTGTIAVFGPLVKETVYPYSVTARWAWQIALLVLVLTGLAYTILLWNSPTLMPHASKAPKNARLVFQATRFVGFLAAFGTVYLADATWGAEPVASVTALISGGIAASTAATGAAALLYRTKDDGDDGG